MSDDASSTTGVVLLAAGASSRMGCPKMLLPWGGTSVLGHLIAQWRRLGVGQITAVHAAYDEKIETELNRCEFPSADRIANSRPERGMFSSIECAAHWPGWKPELERWVIVLGDQPHLQMEILRGLMEFAATHPQKICQPSRNGRARHPVVLPASIFARLKDATAGNLKQFLEMHSSDRALCEMADPGLDLDLDTPSDYQEASELVRKRV